MNKISGADWGRDDVAPGLECSARIGKRPGAQVNNLVTQNINWRDTDHRAASGRETAWRAFYPNSIV